MGADDNVKPILNIPNQLVGVSVGMTATIECMSDLQTKVMWIFKEDLMFPSERHEMVREVGNKQHSRLTIKEVNQSDFGAYKCVITSARGRTEGYILLYPSTQT